MNSQRESIETSQQVDLEFASRELRSLGAFFLARVCLPACVKKQQVAFFPVQETFGSCL